VRGGVVTAFKLDAGAIAAMLAENGVVGKEMRRLANDTLALGTVYAPVDTGRLSGSGVVRRMPDVPGGYDVAFPVHYAIYVHQGTRRMRGRPFLNRALRQVIAT